MKNFLQLLLIFFTIATQGQNKIFSALSEYYDVNSSSWKNYSAGNYEYDTNNNVISVISFEWVDGKWANYSKTIYSYNASNKITEEVFQLWNSSTNTFENSSKDSYSYSNGNPIEILYSEWDSPDWNLKEKTVLSYNSNNLPDSSLFYTWNGTQWAIESRYTPTYNTNSKLIEDLGEKWVNSIWVNDYKSLYTYDSNSKLVTNRIAIWDDFNTIWTERQRIDYVLDANRNRTSTTYSGYINSKLEYSYDTSSLMTSFANPFKDKSGLDYLTEDFPHINKVIGYNEFSYNTQTSSYDLIGRHAYNYNSSITLNAKTEEFTDNNITIYPNPTKDFLLLKTSSNAEIDTIEVTDLTGKTVLEEKNSGKVDVQNLAKGVYILKISVGDKKEIKKFIKE